MGFDIELKRHFTLTGASLRGVIAPSLSPVPLEFAWAENSDDTDHKHGDPLLRKDETWLSENRIIPSPILEPVFSEQGNQFQLCGLLPLPRTWDMISDLFCQEKTSAILSGLAEQPFRFRRLNRSTNRIPLQLHKLGRNRVSDHQCHLLLRGALWKFVSLGERLNQCCLTKCDTPILYRVEEPSS